MLALLLTAALIQFSPDDWTAVEPFNVVTSLEFSPIMGDETVTSTYTVWVLEDKLPEDITGIKSFKVELILESGYTLSGVMKNWQRTEVETASGFYKLPAVMFDLVIDGWDYWDIEIFTLRVWYKLKEGWQKKI